jgi:hypothetical protein
VTSFNNGLVAAANHKCLVAAANHKCDVIKNECDNIENNGTFPLVASQLPIFLSLRITVTLKRSQPKEPFLVPG